jgi:hypothetical protein
MYQLLQVMQNFGRSLVSDFSAVKPKQHKSPSKITRLLKSVSKVVHEKKQEIADSAEI